MLALVTSFIFFFIALARGRNFTYAATFGIGILIAWVPQGLPLAVTTILAISGRKMALENVLVKDFHGLETLGSVTFLATDKTGTLTRNVMSVAEVWINDELFHAGPPFTSNTRKIFKPDMLGVAQLLHICVTCSNAKFDKIDLPVSSRSIIGDATETGLLEFAAKNLANIDRVNYNF